MILKINVSQNIQVLVDTKRLIYLEVVAIFIVQNIVINPAQDYIKNLVILDITISLNHQKDLKLQEFDVYKIYFYFKKTDITYSNFLLVLVFVP